MKLQDFIERAKRGENVFMAELRAAFSHLPGVVCALELTAGGERRFTIPLPKAQNEEERAFLREYFYGNIYNILSVLGGKGIRLYAQTQEARELCKSLPRVFETDKPRGARRGYGKCLTVTDRMNAAMGCAPFSFTLEDAPLPQAENEAWREGTSAVSALRAAAARAQDALLVGMDIGGTDIKLVGAKRGQIAAVKEYDWNPARMQTAQELLSPLLLLARVMRTAMVLPDTPEGRELKQALLAKDTGDDRMLALLEQARESFPEAPLLEGIGVCFPDVVAEDRIVGGETPKTQGMRAACADYETEFAKLSGLKELLLTQCRQGAAVHMANDGSLAAYTAAVELAHGERAAQVEEGVFAHSLGTELGTGYLDENAEIPPIPLELYNCVIDLGDHPARRYAAADARSIADENTGLFGTLRKYAGQNGAYRLFCQYRQEEGLDERFFEARDDGIFVRQSPTDMRKPLLEHIMAQAEQGQPQAEQVFRQIGRYLGATWSETVFLLHPRCQERTYFGRFVKRPRCFALMCEGAAELCDFPMTAGDDALCYTPLMCALRDEPHYTVAQFAQAVGALYFAASALGEE